MRNCLRGQIDVHIDEESYQRTLAGDVLRGLTSHPKYLLPKYFYDPKGSALFESITQLPEYYLTRVEIGLIKSLALEVMDELRPQEIVEIGSGSGNKIRHLLDAPNTSKNLVRYVPFDFDQKTMEIAGSVLMEDYPYLQVHGVIGDFEHHLASVPLRTGRRLAVFFGSTIGNLAGRARHDMLVEIHQLLTPEDRLLLGIDLVKDVAALEAAYNDSCGVTARFNRNILRVINRALNADFQPDAFRHSAYYNQDASRIEMHLIPESPQRVYLRDLGLTVQVSPDESIWTENSYKFTRESTRGMLCEAGLELVHWYTDSKNSFALALAAPGQIRAGTSP